MSLVSTYVRMDDGLWHKNPVIGEGKQWFICYDDDDLIELVLQAQSRQHAFRRLEEVMLRLRSLGCRLYLKKHHTGEHNGETALRRSGMRCFGDDDEFLDAWSLWVWVNKPPVFLLLKQDGAYDERPRGDCVYYEDTDEIPEDYQ